jgi:hypothetical protein
VPVAGLALILGVDRFMSEARALTNLVGNGVATVVVGKWCGELDEARMKRVLDRESPVEADEPEEVLGPDRSPYARRRLVSPRGNRRSNAPHRPVPWAKRMPRRTLRCTASSSSAAVPADSSSRRSSATRSGRRRRADITLIERARTHFWKPHLHEIAAGSMDVAGVRHRTTSRSRTGIASATGSAR